MTAVRPSTVPPAAADGIPGPVPRRVRPPRWLDLRLVLGVLLVLASVLLGARVVGSADATVPVWAVAGDLAAGTELAAGDLVAVDVRLDDAAGAYLSTATRPEGRTLARAVRDGELLPRTALEEGDGLVQLALPVQSGYVPPGLRRGQVVDVYAVADPAAGATAADGSVTLVVRRAPVQALSGRSEGVLSTPTTAVQVVVAVEAEDAADVLAAIAGRPLVVVVHGSVDGDEVEAGALGPAG
ncbi:SAF domain-containing protein [Blastococcus tunisiensis]|uniref:SAF domain-containing protein n=1 Tax=Blastococcus tunisiensis TaxID=1798228 RepID=A0A1I1WNZ2_9ACTN|nr:SAF domain-containing protein [Blastococcus sp. DSM 46838]SFD96846.1 SAF domain-containing protein [Blastococcus sp. DSM 46838]